MIRNELYFVLNLSMIPEKFIYILEDAKKDDYHVISKHLISFLNNNQFSITIKYVSNGYCYLKILKYNKYTFFCHLEKDIIYLRLDEINKYNEYNYNMNELIEFIEINETIYQSNGCKKNLVYDKIKYFINFFGFIITEDDTKMIINLKPAIYNDFSIYYFMIYKKDLYEINLCHNDKIINTDIFDLNLLISLFSSKKYINEYICLRTIVL